MTTPVSDPNPDNAEDNAGDTTIIGKPAAAPVVPAVPPVEPPKADDEIVPVTFEPTGDVGLDMALDFVGKQGIGMEHPAFKAALEGDFTILSAELAAKGVKGWEQYVKLGEAAFTRAKAAEETAKAERKALVHKEAGGEAEWLSIREWAAANATETEKADLNNLLNQGGLAAKSAVKYLVDAYARANNVIREPKDGTGNGAKGNGGEPGPNGPLSPKDYVAAVNALNVKLKGRVDGSPEYKALQARRAAYRG